MKLFERFSKKAADQDSAIANASRKTLTIKGTAAEDAIRSAVEKAGYSFKGKR